MSNSTLCKILHTPQLNPVENFPHPHLYNLKANILKVINILAEITIKGLLVQNFAPAAHESFPALVPFYRRWLKVNLASGKFSTSRFQQ